MCWASNGDVLMYPQPLFISPMLLAPYLPGAVRLTDTREGSQDTAERIDPKFRFEVMKMPGAGKVSLCFQCGTCTADCAVARFSDFYKPRKIARLVQLGLRNRLLSNDSLWLCTTCFTCVDHCPQGVEVSSIVRALRNMSINTAKVMPLVFKVFANNILKNGYVYTMPESRLRSREEQGLPPLPKPNPMHVAKLFEATGLSDALKDARAFDKVKARAGE